MTNVTMSFRAEIMHECQERFGVELNRRLGGKTVGENRMYRTKIFMLALKVCTIC